MRSRLPPTPPPKGMEWEGPPLAWAGADGSDPISKDTRLEGEGMASLSRLLAGFTPSRGRREGAESERAKMVCRGELMRGRDPQTRKEFSWVVTMVDSSLHVTICIINAPSEQLVGVA